MLRVKVCPEPRTELRKQLARRGFLLGLIVVIFIPEPQVNLRNHLPPGDSLFLWIKQPLLMIKLFPEPQVNLSNHLPPGDSLLC